jgi:hypothetical protein
MKKLTLWFLLFSLLELAVPWSAQVPKPKALAILNTSVIDATGAEAAPDETVILKGDRIRSVGRTDEVPIPRARA